jgi:hypothetical protein
MTLCAPASGNTILVAQATQAEAVAALCRKARLGAMSIGDCDRNITIFRRDVRRSYVVERVTSATYT